MATTAGTHQCRDQLVVERVTDLATPSSAAQLAALEAYKKELDKHIAPVRTKVQGEMEAEEADAKSPKASDGTKLAKIVYCQGKISAEITDERAAVEWVKRNYPTEIVETIRPAFLEKLLAAAKAAGVGIDPATSEALRWIDVRQGNAYITVTPTQEARERAAVLLERSLAVESGEAA